MMFILSTLFFTSVIMYVIYKVITLFIKDKKSQKLVAVAMVFFWVIASYRPIIDLFN